MKRWKFWAKIAALLLIIVSTITSCGKEEERQLGIDGYVYVAEKLSWGSSLKQMQQAEEITSTPWLFYRVGDSLYYQCGIDGKTSQRKTSVTDPSLEESESVFYHEGAYTVDEEGNIYYLYCNYYRTNDGSISSVTTWDGDYYWIMPDGAVFVQKSGEAEGYVTEDPEVHQMVVELAKTALYKTSPDGELLYELNLTDQIPREALLQNSLALHEGGNIIVLSENAIYIVDEVGSLASSISVSEYEEADFFTKYLVGGLDGSVYYVIPTPSCVTVYEVLQKETWELARVEALNGQYYGGIYPGRHGFLYSSNDGYLYEYDRRDFSCKQVLKWEDSNLFCENVQGVYPLSEEQLLVVEEVYKGRRTQDMYLLERTAVSELPKKEIIVLASLMPSGELQSMAAEFNRQSSQYHVVVEDYSNTGDAALTRLDASLVSTESVDILDLTFLDIYKYTDKEVLEDLSGFMAESSRIKKEDFLDGVIEGYTINGRLVCIPTTFSFTTLLGRKEQLGDQAGWTMEDCMELAERYPEYGLMAGDASDILSTLCNAYYLERFIDWEAGECSFDSAEFGELLEWVKECGEKNRRTYTTWENSMVYSSQIFYLTGRLWEEYYKGEELVMIGFPTVDGRKLHQAKTGTMLSIVSASRHKEGAWAFLEFYLEEEQDEILLYNFSTFRKQMETQVRYFTEPEYGNEISSGMVIVIGDQIYPYLERETVEDILQAIEGLDFAPKRKEESTVCDIVEEEAADYFNGKKELDEVMDTIQKRVQLLLSERM